MIKLYNTIKNKLTYWETWEASRKTFIVHWGVVGEKGQSRTIKGSFFSNSLKVVRKEIADKITEGYRELDENKVEKLEIQYNIEGFGTEQDIDKRHRLEEKLDEILGWTGLGNVDGGSIGSGTMEVSCRVVDFQIARRIIEEELKDTEFGNYSKIFKIII